MRAASGTPADLPYESAPRASNGGRRPCRLPGPVPALALLGVLLLGTIVFGSQAFAGQWDHPSFSRVKSGRAGNPAIGVVECPACDTLALFSPESFSHPTRIDGKWLPLVPGTQMVLQGVANRGGGLLPHTVTFTVTDLVKRINGIPCVVVWDRDVNEGELRESELAFFAQDDRGNVWNSGEYPEEYEGGVLLGAENTWIHGIEFAIAGIHVQKKPRLGTHGYVQAHAPENDFWDCGQVYAQSKVPKAAEGDDDGDDDGDSKRDGDKDRDRDRDAARLADETRSKVPPVCVPAGCFKDWLVVKEWAPLDGCDIIQLKTYAKGVGIVQVGAIDDPEGESLTLVAINHLTPQQMLEARAGALELDTRGYLINEIYAQTEPAYVAPPRAKDDDDDDDAARLARTDTAVPAHAFMRIAPNPVASFAAIDFSVTQPGPVELSIFDVAGRRIRSIVSEVSPAGTFRAQWDTLDDQGQHVAAGIYFARLRTPAQSVGRTVLISR